jgi:hypothetical protein
MSEEWDDPILSYKYDGAFPEQGMSIVIRALHHEHKTARLLRLSIERAVPALPDGGGAVDLLAPTVEYTEELKGRDPDGYRTENIITAFARRKCIGNKDLGRSLEGVLNTVTSLVAVPKQPEGVVAVTVYRMESVPLPSMATGLDIWGLSRPVGGVHA